MTGWAEGAPAAGVASAPLTGRVALVTGGARNLGLAIAHGLAAAGAGVGVVSRDADAARAAVEEIRAAGGAAHAVAADVGDVDRHAAVVGAVVEAFGRLDILVNNAGMARRAPVEALTPQLYDRVHAVNARAPVFLAQAAAPWLAAHGTGSVINVLSTSLWTGGANGLAYRSSKSALFGATMALAREWAPRRIRVNAVAPGTFDAGLGRALDDDRRAAARAAVPLRRLGRPEELAGAVVYLAGDAASYVTGSVIRIDGGAVSAW